MSDTGSGGYRAPARPAAVSGPGALSQRTDGGPAGQPVQVAPGATQYGGAAELAQGQAVQPLPEAQGLASGPPAGASPAPQAGASLGGIFTDPTGAPGEPVTAGAATGPGPGPQAFFQDDPDAFLREVYRSHPSDDLRSLLEGRDR